LDFDAALAGYVEKLQLRKPVIIGGDFNVAHEFIDIYPENTRNFVNTPGFKEEERGNFANLLSLGFIDTFRLLHPETSDAYTWWASRFNHKAENKGRRLDYFLVSEEMANAVKSSEIHREAGGSDHAPISLEVNP
jgi:exodeoxyribonuclease-3